MKNLKINMLYKNGDGPLAKIVALIIAAIFSWFIFNIYQAEAKREPEILRYQKGTYLGPAVAPLPEETREALRQRTRFQGVETAAAPGGGSSLRGPGEAAPTGLQGQRESTLGRSARELRTGLPEATLDALRARARRQLPD